MAKFAPSAADSTAGADTEIVGARLELGMTRAQVTWAMSALIMSMFFAMMSNTTVLTALPTIIRELHGTQSDYTWIVTVSLLTLTIAIPIWSKLADLCNRKLLIQLSVGSYAVASICAGFASAPWMIIASRVAIGLAVAGIIALLQVIAATITTPRERVRYFSYLGAAMSVASVSAPALGGFIVDLLGWRWCFFITVPLAVAAIVMLQLTLRSNRALATRAVHIDYLGAVLVAVSAAVFMLWASNVGPGYGWYSWQSITAVTGGILGVIALIAVEKRAAEPVLPPRLFGNPTVRKAVVAASVTGIATFASSVFLTQYFQLSRGLSASHAGLNSLPLAVGTLAAALLAGHFIPRFGHYKSWLVAASVSMVVAMLLLSTIGVGTSFVLIGVYIFLLGAGLGVLSENLVIVVQGAVARSDLGAASGLVMFFRSLAGVACVSGFGVLLASRIDGVSEAVASSIAYGSGVSAIYLWCVPIMMIGLVAVCLLPTISLAESDG